jgi:hypothetical protein
LYFALYGEVFVIGVVFFAEINQAFYEVVRHAIQTWLLLAIKFDGFFFAGKIWHYT